MNIESSTTLPINSDNLIVLLSIILLCFVLFDVNYFLHLLGILIWGQFRRKKQVDDTLNYYGMCTTQDLDAEFTHMNNVKFLKNLDFARFHFYERTGLLGIFVKTKSKFVQAASNIRYRRPIALFSFYKITTKIIYYDEKNVYFQQDIITCNDNFIRATTFSKQTIIGLNVATTINQLLNHTESYRPELSDELNDWINLIEKSSINLRNKLNVE